MGGKSLGCWSHILLTVALNKTELHLFAKYDCLEQGCQYSYMNHGPAVYEQKSVK
jgi:hypothetical protein